MLVSALAIAGTGLRVIPLEDKEKKPRLKGWVKKGTTDTQTIESWFRRYPSANLGICTGGGIIVLDVDPKHGGSDSLAKLIEEHGSLPTTAQVRTGSGGSHYFFRVEPDAPLRNRTHFLPGLDIRGDGGQVVAPPSVHPETVREYEFVRHPAEGIAPAPGWLMAILTPPANPNAKPTKLRLVKKVSRPGGKPPENSRRGDPRRLLEEMRQKFPIPGPGRRHCLMVKVVGSLMGRGFADDLVIHVTMAWWKYFRALGMTHTGEPSMRADLHNCIQSTRANKSFRPSVSGFDHGEMCRSIVLSTEQKAWLRARVVAGDDGRKNLQLDSRGDRSLPTCKSETRASRIGEPLCTGDDEHYFVMALIVHAMHKRINLGEEVIRMTHDQLREIMQARHPRGHEWRGHDTQIGRLKRRYVSWHGQPAQRFELLQMTQVGKPGTPSEYVLTGMLFFLELANGHDAAASLVA